MSWISLTPRNEMSTRCFHEKLLRCVGLDRMIVTWWNTHRKLAWSAKWRRIFLCSFYYLRIADVHCRMILTLSFFSKLFEKERSYIVQGHGNKSDLLLWLLLVPVSWSVWWIKNKAQWLKILQQETLSASLGATLLIGMILMAIIVCGIPKEGRKTPCFVAIPSKKKCISVSTFLGFLTFLSFLFLTASQGWTGRRVHQ